MNKNKYLFVPFAVLAFTFIFLFGIFTSGNNQISAKAMEVSNPGIVSYDLPAVENPINIPTEEQHIIGRTFVFEPSWMLASMYFEDDRLYTVPFISNGRFFDAFAIFNLGGDYISLVYYDDASGEEVGVFEYGNGEIYNSHEEYYKIQITGLVEYSQPIQLTDYRNVITKFFSFVPYDHKIQSGVYSLKANLPAIPSDNIFVYLGDKAYGYLPNNTFNQLFSLYSKYGIVNLRNQQIIDPYLVRKGSSELIYLTEDILVSEQQFDFFKSFYDVAPVINAGEYRIRTEDFVLPTESPFNFNYNIFARMPFEFVGQNTNTYNSIYFKDSIIDGNNNAYYSLVISTSTYPNFGSTLTVNEVNLYANGWLSDNQPEFNIQKNSYVSLNFYNYFMSVTDSYARITGSYVFNNNLVLPKENLSSTNVFLGGSFSVFTSNQSYVTTDFSEIYVTTDGKVTFQGYNKNGEVNLIVYNLGWVDNNFKYVYFQNLAVTDEMYKWIIENTTVTANWDFIDNAYNIGYQAGLMNGNNNGYADGYNAGKDAGYNQGYNDGYNLAASETTFSGLFGAVISTPFNVIQDFLDFNILGFNMNQVFFSLLSLCTIIALIRWLL